MTTLSMGIPSKRSGVYWIPFYNIVLDSGKMFSVDAYFLGSLHFMNRGLLARRFEDKLASNLEVSADDRVLQPLVEPQRAVDLLYDGYLRTLEMYEDLYSQVKDKMKASPLGFVKALFLGFKAFAKDVPEAEMVGKLRAALILYEELLGGWRGSAPQVRSHELFWKPYLIVEEQGGLTFLDASTEAPRKDKFYTGLYEMDEGMKEAVGRLILGLA